MRTLLVEVLHGLRLREENRSMLSIGEDELGIVMVTDCRSLYDHMKVQGAIPDDRQTAIWVAALRCGVSAGPGRNTQRAWLRWTPSRWQLGDVLTKGGLSDNFRKQMRDGDCLFCEPSAQSMKRDAAAATDAAVKEDGSQ